MIKGIVLMFVAFIIVQIAIQATPNIFNRRDKK